MCANINPRGAIFSQYTREAVEPLLVCESSGEDTERKMADRDNNVYLAKLAEQAERYDGKCVAV